MLNNINVGSVPSNIWNTILCCIYLFDYLYRDKRIAHMPLKQYDFLLQYIYRTTFSMLIISDGDHYLSWWVMASDGGTGVVLTNVSGVSGGGAHQWSEQWSRYCHQGSPIIVTHVPSLVTTGSQEYAQLQLSQNTPQQQRVKLQWLSSKRYMTNYKL